MTEKSKGLLIFFGLLALLVGISFWEYTTGPQEVSITINTTGGVHLIDDVGREVGSLSGFGDEIVVRIKRKKGD